jgi:hypothetical protein
MESRRKTNRNRREKDANQDKELGTQPMLEEVLKKEGKSGKVPIEKDSLNPQKRGKENMPVNNEGSLLEL